MLYDVIVIGCGVVGAAVAYELSKYRLSAVVLEKENDVACHTTKANSAIIHAGYDPEPGTLMAKLNVKGSRRMEELARNLSVDYHKTGSLVLGFTEEDSAILRKLYQNGLENGVQRLELISGARARELEPNLSSEVRAALYAPSAAIICPWDLCLAMAEVAVKNGVELRLESGVTGIEKTNSGFLVHTASGDFSARYVVNAAGTHADEIHNMVSAPMFKTLPSRGQYHLLDKNQGGFVGTVIFQCPTPAGKGVLVAPTVHGNLIVGPNAEHVDDGEDVATTSRGLEQVRTLALKSVPQINFRESIRSFAGVRAVTDQDDFIIAEAKDAVGFIDLAGMKSPGLSAAPAVAVEALSLLSNSGLELGQKENWDGKRPAVSFNTCSPEEKAELIRKNPRYGRVICRCETITEGDLVRALHSDVPARTLDGVKRRCGAGMGRCQGGFCGPKVQEIIARELGLPMEKVLLDRAGTIIITGETKSGGGNHAGTTI